MHELVVNLIAAALFSLLGFLAGVSRSLVGMYRRRRAHGFWRRFGNGALHVVVAPFRGDSQVKWEPSGLYGTGDMVALHELQTTMATLRRPVFDVVFEEGIGRNDKRDNLILIGGPDANPITREILDGVGRLHRLGLRFRKRWFSPTTLLDLREGKTLAPRWERSTLNRKNEAVVDYGIIVFAENPFDDRRRVLVVAGVYGYATLAGVMLLNDPAFLDDPVVRSGLPFECLYEAEVVGNIVIRPRRERWRTRLLPPAVPVTERW